MIGMKRKVPFLLLLGIGLPGLAGCSFFPPGAKEDYFRVDLYGDYEGIDADLAAKKPDASKARHLGYCWAKVGDVANIEGYSVLDSHRYSVSDRTAPNGYEYTFDSWKGFYADGNAINLESIQSDCALFTTFKLTPKQYLVSLECNYDTLVSDYATFGKKIGEVETLKMTADATDHDPRHYGYDPYYMDYSFQGYRVETKHDDNTVTTKDVAGFAQINDLVIEGTTTITVLFAEAQRSYSVELVPYYEHLDAGVYVRDPLSGTPGIPAGAFDTRTLAYDAALGTMADLTGLGYSFSYIEGKYAADAPAAVAGRDIDADHIRYNGKVDVIYRDYQPETKVTFHLDPSDASKTEVRTYRQSTDPALNYFDYPDGKINTPAEFAFTGRYYVGDELGAFVSFYDEAKLFDQPTLDLYPYFAPRKMVYVDEDKAVNHNAKVYDRTFYYYFDADFDGYVLENFALIERGSDPIAVLKDSNFVLDLAATDFWDEGKPANYSFPEAVVSSTDKARLLDTYSFTSISSFHSFHSTAAKASSSSKVNRLTLPASVTTIFPSGFSELHHLCWEGGTTLDLSASKITFLGEQAFRDDLNIEKIILPALTQADSLCFYGCENLTSVEINLSADAYAEAKAAGDFHADWNKKELGGAEVPLTFLG